MPALLIVYENYRQEISALLAVMPAKVKPRAYCDVSTFSGAGVVAGTGSVE